MNVSEKDAISNFAKLLTHVQENGRDVNICKDQKVVAVISPAGEESALDNSPLEATTTKGKYQTWGETLKE